MKSEHMSEYMIWASFLVIVSFLVGTCLMHGNRETYVGLSD